LGGLTKEEIHTDKIVGSIPMPPHEIFKLQDEVWAEWQRLPPTEEGLPRKLKLLRKSDFKVLVVTCRPQRSENYVKKWLDWQKIPYEEFHALGPYEFKTKIEADALVDDVPNEIRRFVRSGRIGFLYAQPWNRSAKVGKAVIVKNISDVLRFYRLSE
jgi:hypothetical protein